MNEKMENEQIELFAVEEPKEETFGLLCKMTYNEFCETVKTSEAWMGNKYLVI